MKTSFRGYRVRSDTVDLWVSIIPFALFWVLVALVIMGAPSIEKVMGW